MTFLSRGVTLANNIILPQMRDKLSGECNPKRLTFNPPWLSLKTEACTFAKARVHKVGEGFSEVG